MLRHIFFCALVCAALALCLGGLHGKANMQTMPLRRVTETPEERLSLNPAMSGDGRSVAFESNADLAGTGGVSGFRAFRAALDTGPPVFTQLGATRAHTPTISQSGESIAFASKDNPLGNNLDGNSEIFLYAAGHLRQVTNTLPANASLRHVHGNFQPSLTDDGRFIAFSSNRELTGHNPDANLEIFLFDTHTNAFAQLTETTGIIGSTDAEISGDASHLTFIKDNGLPTPLHEDEANAPTLERDLMLVELASGESRTIAAGVRRLGLTTGRAISDDGKRVIYSAELATDATQVMLYDGRNRLTRQLTALGARASDVPLHPTISGDGKFVAFATRRNVTGGNSDNSVELYTLDLLTGQLARLTDAPAAATAEVISSFNDDGSLIAFSFPRVLSGAVTSGALANNPEIYVAITGVRPPFSTALNILNGASHGHEPETARAVAPDSITVAHGHNLSYATMQAEPLPGGAFPTTLGGTSVTVNDRPCQILSVSPTRVMFHLPPETEHAFASVTVTNPEGFQTRGSVRILRHAPGIFTESGNGTGTGLISDAETGAPGPFDPTSGPRALVIYATGARRAPAPIQVTIGGRQVKFLSLTPNASTPGLDELRVELPRDLRGAGTVQLSVSAGRRRSNHVMLTIAGEFGRKVYLNEVLADPPDGMAGDANYDGVRDGAADEFIELANAQTDDVDVSGWTIRTRALTGTNETTRHVFAPGTILPARDAVVIFGGGGFDPQHPAFGGARVVATSTAGLSLTNTGLNIIVRDAAGHLITEFNYGGSTGLDGNANQSLTRAPDISGQFILHTQAAGSNGRAFSPGTRLDGGHFQHRPSVLSSVVLTPAVANAVEGSRAQFSARAFDQFQRPMRFLDFGFDLSDQSIASIESTRIDRPTGTVTLTLLCHAAGTTALRASVSNGTVSLTSAPSTLNVLPAPPRIARVVVWPETSVINRGGTRQFTATAFDEHNQVVTGVSFAWSTNRPWIADVDAFGLARGLGHGRAFITATADDGMGSTVSGLATLDVLVPLVINEVLADVPPDDAATLALEGDANRDGTRDSGADEFVELFNFSAEPVDISGLIIADGTSNRYTFPQGTLVLGGRSLIVFGGGNAPVTDPAFGGAMVFTAGSLGLNDTGDTVQLKLMMAGAETTIASLAFGGSGQPTAPSNQSLTRAPDAGTKQTGGDFVPHLNAADSAARTFSPGTRTGGTPFNSGTLLRLSIQPSVASINVGETQAFTARAFIGGGGGEVEIQNVSLSWDSSEASVAAVTQISGATTSAVGVAAGTVTIRARAGGLEALATLHITPPPQVLTRIEVSPTNAVTVVGGTRQFTARGFDQHNSEIPGLLFNWTSSRQSVATIDEHGLATAHGLGTTEIRAAAGQVTSEPAILSVTVPVLPNAGQVIINEALVSHAAATPVRADFVELYNPTPHTLDVSGLVIRFRGAGNTSVVSVVTLPGGVGSGALLLAPYSYFLIANGPQTFGVTADFDAGSSGFDLNNSSGAVMIELGGMKVDGLRYQQNGSGAPPAAFDGFGEGTLFNFAGGTPNDLIRSPNATDTGNNAVDFRRNNSHVAVSPKAPNPTLP